MQVKFKKWLCDIEFKQYGNGRTAIVLNDANDHSRIAVASVNMPETELEKNEICIKDYSENEGMLKALIDVGIVKDTGKRVESGFVTIPICELI